jgi:HK97 family phage major capsid protein
MNLEEVRSKANELAIAMQAVLDGASGPTLSGDERAKFDDLDKQRDAFLDTEKRMLKLEESTRAQAQADRPVGRRSEADQPVRQEQRGSSPAPSDPAQLEALRGFFITENRTARSIDAMKRMGIPLDAKTLNLRMASRAPVSRSAADMKEWQERYLGVDLVSPDNGGHYLVPDETMRQLEVALLAFGGMREVATVLRTDTGGDLPIPTMNDTSNEGAIIGEGIEETNEVEPTIGQLVLEAFMYSSRKIPVSREFMQDNAVNFAARVGEILGQRIARITNRHFTVGTGNSQPKGIVTAATSSGVTTATATGFVYDEIVELVHSVDPAYRTTGKFMFHDNTLLALKKIKVPQFSGDTNGQPLWRPGMTVGAPDTIDGYRYVINQHMPLPVASQKAMIFGALEKYQIRDVRDLEVVRLDELRAEFRQVVWMAWYRGDGDLLDAGTHPVKYLTMHS